MQRSIKILAGKKRGLKLVAPDQSITRVTLSRIKQSLFDILSHNTKLNSWKRGGCVVDTFAGSGSLAFEALSRGANRLLLIELTQLAFETLKRNKNLFYADAAFIDSKVEIILSDFFNVSLDKTDQVGYSQPDLIFLDPPYNIYTVDKLLTKTKNLFDTSKAIIVYQRPTKTTSEFELQSIQSDNSKFKIEIIKKLVIGSNTFEIFKFYD